MRRQENQVDGKKPVKAQDKNQRRNLNPEKK
jgi:hypothetical protein